MCLPFWVPFNWMHTCRPNGRIFDGRHRLNAMANGQSSKSGKWNLKWATQNIFPISFIQTRMEENGFRLIWELFANPLLFLLLGTFLDFSSPPFSFALLGQSLLILLLSLAIRFISSLAIAFACFQPSQPQERIFLGLALLPKGTLQTALLPFIFHHAENEDGIDLLAQTSLLALLLCAPIGELAIRLLGPILLRQKMLPSVATSIVPSGPTLLKGKVTHSDPRDNLLRVRNDRQLNGKFQ
jgi:hypothetical protein